MSLQIGNTFSLLPKSLLIVLMYTDIGNYSSLEVVDASESATRSSQRTGKTDGRKGCPNSLLITVVLLSFLGVLGGEVALC